MELPYYQVNAFTKSLFGGNPAGVCSLEDWLGDEQMRAIAAESFFCEAVGDGVCIAGHAVTYLKGVINF